MQDNIPSNEQLANLIEQLKAETNCSLYEMWEHYRSITDNLLHWVGNIADKLDEYIDRFYIESQHDMLEMPKELKDRINGYKSL